jgi:hypothetical protein
MSTSHSSTGKKLSTDSLTCICEFIIILQFCLCTKKIYFDILKKRAWAVDLSAHPRPPLNYSDTYSTKHSFSFRKKKSFSICVFFSSFFLYCKPYMSCMRFSLLFILITFYPILNKNKN